MRTHWPNSKDPQHPEELLRRFGARLSLLYGVAYGSLDTHDLAETSELSAEPIMDRKLGHAIFELVDDFEQLQEAVAEWFKTQKDGAE